MSKTRIGNFACAAIALIMMICLFTPFWTVPETGETASIGDYVGFPEDNPELKKYLESTEEDYNINSVVFSPAMFMLLGAVSIVLCLLKSDQFLCAILPAAAGCLGAWGYITQSALQLGGTWVLHLALCLLLVAVAVATIVIGAREQN